MSLLDHFSALEDPRQSWKVVYPLPEIMLLVLCATISGMEDFVEIRLWGQERLDFLRRFLPYKRGLPSHDTLNDVMNALDVELFNSCFTAWVEALRYHCADLQLLPSYADRVSRGGAFRRIVTIVARAIQSSLRHYGDHRLGGLHWGFHQRRADCPFCRARGRGSEQR